MLRLLPRWAWIVAGIGLSLFALWLARTCYRERIADLERERNNALARADTLRQVAGGWERRAVTAEKEKELLGQVDDELREHLDRSDRRLRAVTNVVTRIEDTFGIDAEAVARGDSTQIRWQHSDSVIDLRVALAFPGMIRPLANPHVTGTADLSARVAAQVAISCDPETGAPFANASVMDRRVAVTALDVAVDDRVSCLEPPSWKPLSFDIRPNVPWAVAGAAAGYLLAR